MNFENIDFVIGTFGLFHKDRIYNTNTLNISSIESKFLSLALSFRINFFQYSSLYICMRVVTVREEKSLRHVAMVAKFLDDNKSKRHSKSGFELFQTSSILFNFI